MYVRIRTFDWHKVHINTTTKNQNDKDQTVCCSRLAEGHTNAMKNRQTKLLSAELRN